MVVTHDYTCLGFHPFNPHPEALYCIIPNGHTVLSLPYVQCNTSISPAMPILSQQLSIPAFHSFVFLQSDAAKSNIYKKHFYFCFNNKFLITNLPGNYTIGTFQTYINWFINSIDHQYVFVPLLQSNETAKLSDIKEVIFNSMKVTPKDNNLEIEPTYNKIFNLGLTYIKELLNDTISLSDEELQQVISAKLLLDIKRPKSMSEKEYQQKFGSIMKPIADGDNVQYKLKNGKTIKSQEMAVTKSVKIELTDKGYPVEEQIKQNMLLFLHEVEKNVHA